MSDASAEPQRVTAATVDYIFRRLLARYGSAFENKWPDAAIADAKADWLSVIGPDALGRGGLTAEQVRHALDNLPKDFPPNSSQFRDAALRAPAPAVAKVKHEVKPDLPRLTSILRRVVDAQKGRSPRAWIAEIQAIPEAQRSPAQVAALRNVQEAPPLEADAIVDLERRKADAARAVANYTRDHP